MAQRRPWTLRRQLTVMVAGLLLVVSALIGIVSVLSLRSFLTERLDQQLVGAVNRSTAAIGFIPSQNMNRPGHNHDDDRDRDHAQGALTAPGQAAGTLVGLSDGQDFVSAGILNSDGEVVALDEDTAEDLMDGHIGSSPTTIRVDEAGEYRAVSVTDKAGQSLVIGLPMTEVNAATMNLLIVILVVTGLGVAVAIIAGRVLIRYELRPLDRVAKTASEVAELPLDKGNVDLALRVDEADTDARTEVGRVGMAVNHMLSHIGLALSARQASEDKVRRFVADASHELRTPLASIRGYAELTRRSGVEIPEDVRHSLSRIESEATRMTGLVEDLLLLARLDEGRELEAKPVDLSRIIVDAVGDAYAAGPDHQWDVSIPDEPVEIIGDQARLHQVVVNLLANARVHTPAGSSVTVSLTPEDNQVVLSVIDDGPGIPQDQMPALFERFTRGDASRNRATGTTGLGLAIVHAVVSAHHGSVKVISEPGRTEFQVTLPKNPAVSSEQ